MRHPKAIQLVRNYIADLAGVERPAEVKAGAEVAVQPGAATAVGNLPETMRLDIDVAKIMDAPITVGPDYMLALVKVSEGGEGGIAVSQAAVDAFSAFTAAQKVAAEQPAAVAGEAPKKAKTAKEVPQVKVLQTWDVPDDTIGDYDYKVEKVENFTGNKVDLLGNSAEEGIPEGRADWRQKLENREQMVQYLKTGLRYWYSKDVFGSEKRKTPA